VSELKGCRLPGVPRRHGRPTIDPNGERAGQLTVSLPPAQLDHLCRLALKSGVSVPELVRRKLAFADNCLEALRTVANGRRDR